jgi:hypothetical protein
VKVLSLGVYQVAKVKIVLRDKIDLDGVDATAYFKAIQGYAGRREIKYCGKEDTSESSG